MTNKINCSEICDLNDILATRWVVALKSEANPIIKRYNMRLVNENGPFLILKDDARNNWLVVSGVGQINAAAATVYLHQKSQAPPWTIWINIGIAGHLSSGIGTLYQIDKVTGYSMKKTAYPFVIKSRDILRAALLTVDRPTTDYPEEQLLDMEGFSFFQTASRFCTKELVLIFKIVSDGPKNHMDELNAKSIEQLIELNLEKIEHILTACGYLSMQEYETLFIPSAYQIINQRMHFTITQQYQLKYLLKRWSSTFSDRDPIKFVKHLNESKSVINSLSSEFSCHQVDWEKI